MGYAKPYWRMFALSIVGMLFYAATEPAFAAMMKPLLDGTFIERDMETVRLMPVLLIGIFLVRGVAGFINSYCLSWVGRRVVADLRQAMFDHLLRSPTRYYDNHGSGQILSKLTYNVENVASAATQAVTTLVRDGFSIIGLVAYMLYLNAALSVIFLVVGPILALAVRYATKRFRRVSRRIQDRVGDLTHAAQEVIDGHRVVKAFGGQAYESAHFSAINEKTRALQMKMIATEAINTPVVQLILALVIAAIVYLSTVQGVREGVSVGTFMSFVVAMALLLAPIKRLTSVNSHLQRGITAAESLFELLDSETEQDTGTRTLARAEGRLEYRGVTHVYSEDKGAVLQGIDLVLAPGETVALVGRSGSGKTTLASLLPRFYDPSAGQILIDGIDIPRSDPGQPAGPDLAGDPGRGPVQRHHRQQHRLCPRQRQVTREELEQVAEAAHALGFIQALPQGFDTLIGDRGVLLSGGQRQRLAIARAMLKDAPFLVLDEATSSLDTEAERHIQAALERLMAHRTTLVIAHRLSTIEKADRIVVMQDGRIVEQGPHAELLALGGYYARLHRLQFHTADQI